MALNYLGAGNSGTMPAAIPTSVPGNSKMADLMGAVRGPMEAPLPPELSQAIRPSLPAAGPAPIPMPPGPGDAKYEAVTQEDGSVLLHVKNPDGSIGPAVKIIPLIKAKTQP